MAGELDNIQLGMSVELSKAKADMANFGQQAVKEVAKVNQQLSSTAITADGKLKPSLTQSNFQLMNMSRIVQDMPFGFLGIGNNITFMAEQMTRAKQEGIGIKQQMAGMLTSLTGVGGIMFAISVITSLLTVWSMKSRETKQEMRELKLDMIISRTESELWEISAKNIREDLTKLSELDLASTIKRAREEMFQLGRDLQQIKEDEAWGGGFVSILQAFGLMTTSEELRKKIKEHEAVIEEGLKIQEGTVDLVQKQEAIVQKIRDEEAATNDQLIDKNRRLQIAEKELNRLKKLGVEIIKEGTESLVIQYRTADEYFESLFNRTGRSSLRDMYFATRRNRDEAAAITEKQINDIINEDIKALTEENVLLEDQSFIWDDIGSAAAQAGRSWVSAMTGGLQILRNNNSMLQQFINLLGQAIAEMIAFKAASFLLNLATGGLSSLFSSPSPSVPSGGSYGGGGGVSKPAYFPGSGGGRTFVNTVVQPVAVTGRIVGEGRQLYVIVEKEKTLVTRFQ